MRWEKKGLVYGPNGSSSWAKHSALTPSPFLMGDVIRIYAGFRDGQGVSRIGYVDVDANNPSRVLTVSKDPVLDIGQPGMFDDNGMILGDVVSDGTALRMYYVGFQLVEKAKFLAFSGLAVSTDNGKSFDRIKNTPIMDRTDEGCFIRAIHTVMLHEGTWKVWYAVGSTWRQISGMPYPSYFIKYAESVDGLTFGSEGRESVVFSGDEYRIGRPKVYKKDDAYHMFYTKGTISGDYSPGYAKSLNGKDWLRGDASLNLALSNEGWDSKHLCYPALIAYRGRTYAFYNGNHMGKDGFGYAELISWD